jgi:hypothetical protein
VVKKTRELVTTVTPETPGIPRAVVLTVSSALSLVTGLSCHHHPQETCKKLASRELDASVGASGPHGFAVRLKRRSSLSAVRVHRIPPRVRDDREPPLCLGRDGEGYAGDLGLKGTGIFLRRGLDSRIGDLPRRTKSTGLWDGFCTCQVKCTVTVTPRNSGEVIQTFVGRRHHRDGANRRWRNNRCAVVGKAEWMPGEIVAEGDGGLRERGMSVECIVTEVPPRKISPPAGRFHRDVRAGIVPEYQGRQHLCKRVVRRETKELDVASAART